MSNKIAERIGAVELSSAANLQARGQALEETRVFRWLCAEHVRLFGWSLTMWLLWQQPLPHVDCRIKIARKHALYAKALDGVTVSRAFYPAKYPGYCYVCEHNCLKVNCAITRWGTGWARYECWCDELQWIDSHEFHRREVLTDANFDARMDTHALWVAFQHTNHKTWEQLRETAKRKISDVSLAQSGDAASDIIGKVLYTANAGDYTSFVVGKPTGSISITVTAATDDTDTMHN